MQSPATSPSSRRNHIGTVSLSIAAVGFCSLEVAHHLWQLSGVGWILIRAGFEAAVIGGIADWFAVTALFHPVPSGKLALPHTDLVVKNRAKLTDGLVDMVENHLLSPSSVRERLRDFSASRLILEQLESPSGRTLAVNTLCSLARRFSGELEDSKLREFVTELLREQIRRAKLASLLGNWLEARIASGDTRVLWSSLVESLADQADAGELDGVFQEMIQAALVAYQAEANWFKGKLASVFVNPESDAASLRSATSRVLRELAGRTNHPLCRKLDEVVLGFACKLSAGDAQAVAHIQAVQTRLADHANFELVVGHLLSDLRQLIQSRLDNTPEELNEALDGVIERSIIKLKEDAEAQDKVDAWARSALEELVTRYHTVIGDTARKSIERLDSKELVEQLEGKIGQDLQYIRLNGAIVGALAGVIIAGMRLLPSWIK